MFGLCTPSACAAFVTACITCAPVTAPTLLSTPTAALALAPGDAHVLNRLALLERAHGNRTQAALALFERALASDPAHTHALANYALLLEDEGRQGEAYACLRRAARLAPDDADALCNLGHFEHTVRRRLRARARAQTHACI